MTSRSPGPSTGRWRELPNIHHRKDWERGVVHIPDYRITCLFVDSRYRRQGMAAAAVRGALALIAAGGGGLVDCPKGKGNCVMTKVVASTAEG